MATNRIIKHRVVVYKEDGTEDGEAFELTPFVQNWEISNGDPDSSGIDGVVQQATISVKNGFNYNFNPENEYGVKKTVVIQFVGVVVRLFVLVLLTVEIYLFDLEVVVTFLLQPCFFLLFLS